MTLAVVMMTPYILLFQTEEDDCDEYDSDSYIGSQEIEEMERDYKPTRPLVSRSNSSKGSDNRSDADDKVHSNSNAHLNLASLCALSFVPQIRMS